MRVGMRAAAVAGLAAAVGWSLGCETVPGLSDWMQEADAPQEGSVQEAAYRPASESATLPPHPERARTRADGALETTVLPAFEDAAARRRQEQPVWCWAACAEMILHAQGSETTQEEIVKRIHGADDGGHLRVEAATRYEILCALNPDLSAAPFERIWEGISAQVSEHPELLTNSHFDFDKEEVYGVIEKYLVPDRKPSVEDLRQGYASVVGLREPGSSKLGHAYVLYGATYEARDEPRVIEAITQSMIEQWSFSGKESLGDLLTPDHYSISRVFLIDPISGDPVEMDYDEFESRTQFAISATAAREQLLQWSRVAVLEED